MNRLLSHPENSELNHVVDQILPRAIVAAGGLCERQDHSYDVAFDPEKAEGLALQGIHRLTASGQPDLDSSATWISFAHPLIQSYADKVIDSAPIEILSFTSARKLQPQRVLEKLIGTLHTRPQKQELVSTTEGKRVLVHSLFLLNLESFDRGQRVIHLLQDEKGEFFPTPRDSIKRIEDRMLDFDLEHLHKIPQALQLKWQTSLEAEMFFAEFQGEIAAMKREEFETAKKYFDSLAKDLETRIEKLKLAPYLGGRKTTAETKKNLESLRTKLEKIQNERDARLLAIEERYRARFSVQPIGARILILPTFHCQIRIGDVDKGAVVTIDYCPALREFFPPRCPSCHGKSWDLVLKAGDNICGKCAGGKIEG